MIITITQTKSNSAAEFTVSTNGKYTNWGQCPSIFKSFSCILCDENRELIYQTKYQFINNLKNNIPYIWIFSEVHTKICSILNPNNESIGSFEHVRTGWLGTYDNINFKNFNIKAYSISKGTNKNMLLFLGDKQIGQIVKSLCVMDNLDKYYLYLLDEYSQLSQALSMFTLYYDNWNYGHQLEYVKYKAVYQKEYTFSKYNKLYNPAWLSSNFNEIEIDNSKVTNSIKKSAKKLVIWFAIGWGIVLLIILIIFLVVYINS
ncbi:hypothetical protein [Clostridium vincentii]|uniref:Uncharacterized protein n=1 Tax=Clostridium vincentii TaxID=52704 RepID=A0A2T0BFJ7_9CLOT|nr:hypothetical protein [Clostridium vincentii]PRR82665.1 hypothetical protein CLVI_16320 [Clostridium vincentii]